MDYSPPGSSVHGILQARILEWVAISFSRGSSQIRDWTHVFCTVRQILYHWTTREALKWFKCGTRVGFIFCILKKTMLVMSWSKSMLEKYWGTHDSIWKVSIFMYSSIHTNIGKAFSFRNFFPKFRKYEYKNVIVVIAVFCYSWSEK